MLNFSRLFISKLFLPRLQYSALMCFTHTRMLSLQNWHALGCWPVFVRLHAKLSELLTLRQSDRPSEEKLQSLHLSRCSVSTWTWPALISLHLLNRCHKRLNRGMFCVSSLKPFSAQTNACSAPVVTCLVLLHPKLKEPLLGPDRLSFDLPQNTPAPPLKSQNYARGAVSPQEFPSLRSF